MSYIKSCPAVLLKLSDTSLLRFACKKSYNIPRNTLNESNLVAANVPHSARIRIIITMYDQLRQNCVRIGTKY